MFFYVPRYILDSALNSCFQLTTKTYKLHYFMNFDKLFTFVYVTV